MLKLNNIVKNYHVGDTTVEALRGVSLEFREKEFVSVLGPSGCGKTTLLNIIGGLDRYTSGDLIINGRSTKDYRDHDWDTYRNHSVGFVFQSYNLIPHQSVLSNVELALTLSGVSREERRRRATEALEKVGLGDQLNKRPNQMSGGQMQRVAIARALVNDPDILLADEPTGALDSETSVQIMDILKEISSEKLIIMVTHNPDLAEQYSSRIIRLSDGRVTDDSDPIEHTEEEQAPKKEKKEKTKKKPSMSFLTAIALSFNNLLTKKARTFLTSFAGSIGIIGIALILSMSNGVNIYISSVQKDTLASAPISIVAEQKDASAMLSALMKARNNEREHELDRVYSNTVMYELINSLNDAEAQRNNLRDFKKFLDKEMDEKTSATGLYKYATSVRYGYDLDINVYTKLKDNSVVKADMESLIKDVYNLGDMTSSSSASAMSGSGMSSFSAMSLWEELLPGNDGQAVSQLVRENYDMVYGKWPTKYDEIVLVVDENNEVTDMTLYALGLKTADELREEIRLSMNGEQLDVTKKSWSYKEICDTDFRIVPASDRFTYDPEKKQYVDLDITDAGMKYLYDNGITLKVTGIIRPNDDDVIMMTGAIGYTSLLTDVIVERAAKSDIVKTQLKSPDTDVITGQRFQPDTEPDEKGKVTLAKEYIVSLDDAQKTELYKQIVSTPDEEYLNKTAEQTLAAMNEEQKTALLVQAVMEQTGMGQEAAVQYLAGLDAKTREGYVGEAVKAMVSQQYAEQLAQKLANLTDEQGAEELDKLIEDYDTPALVKFYDQTVKNQFSKSNYDQNLRTLGYVDMESPFTVNIYSETFENKEAVADIIADYNDSVAEKDQISYTDYMAFIMSSVTDIINAISYVLIAFVSISLVVSSIMIGIITYISVLERTKEIGVLRSIGASKRDVSRVFNAETLIIGFGAGAIGILVTVLTCIPINIIIHRLTDIYEINAVLPVAGGVILVIISMFLTFIAGLIPARLAAKKDPVEALRSE